MSGVIAAVAGAAAISIGSAYIQSEQMKHNAEFQEGIGELNAQAAEIDGEEAYRQGVSKEVRALGQVEKIKAEQDAAIATSGVTVGGSVADLIHESNLNAGLNLLDIEQDAINRRTAYRREAAQRRTQGKINSETANVQAQNTMISGYASAASIAASAYSGSGKKTT